MKIKLGIIGIGSRASQRRGSGGCFSLCIVFIDGCIAFGQRNAVKIGRAAVVGILQRYDDRFKNRCVIRRFGFCGNHGGNVLPFVASPYEGNDVRFRPFIVKQGNQDCKLGTRIAQMHGICFRPCGNDECIIVGGGAIRDVTRLIGSSVRQLQAARANLRLCRCVRGAAPRRRGFKISVA